jgi:poly(3-hydroxybutyrate) depolymerase
MTYSLMCYAPELFAGFAVVSQTLNLEDAKACKVDGKPVVLITGDQDPKSFWHGKPGTMSVPQTVDFLRAQAGCSADKSTKTIDEPGDGTRVRHVTYGDCSKVASVELLHIEGGAHAWPGRAKAKAGQCQDIDGGRVVLDYFHRSAGL